ncbi:MAG TPA: immunoglobulin domain-containing protein, partial [Verrucomicrobiae bacterium]
MKRYLLAVVATWCVCIGAHGQNWFNSRTLPAGNPSAQPALSYDGRFVYWAWQGGVILSSANWGVSWDTNSIASVTNIYSIVCSTNGSKVVIAANNGIYYSSTAGNEWVKTTAPAQAWKSVAVSADGSKIVAADMSGTSGIYRSEDSGQTWTQVKADGTWGWVSSSADGSVLVAAAVQFTDFAIISTNSGAGWQSLNQRLYSAEMSADGSKMIAVPQSTSTEFLTSTNSGATWTDHWEGFGSGYGRVQISADGRTMFGTTASTVKRFDPVLQSWFSDSFTGITSGGMSGDGKSMVVSYAAAIGIWSAERPIIVRNPVTLTVWPRTNLNFTASVVGAPPITYHWTFNDEPVGSNSSLLQWTATNSGAINLTVENAFGSDSITHTILNVLPIGARMNIVAADNWPFGAVVAPGSSDTAVWFEWGISNSFDHATAITNILAGGIKSLAFPAPRMELGVYNVRVTASNSTAVTVSLPARYVPSPVTAGMDTGSRVTFTGLGFHW